MPSTSEPMGRLFAMSLRLKRGQLSKPSTSVKRIAKTMSERQLHDYSVKAQHAKPYRYHNGSS